MSYVIKFDGVKCHHTGNGLSFIKQDNVSVFVESDSGITGNFILETYNKGDLDNVLDKRMDERFVFYIFDESKKILYAYNDHFGSMNALFSWKADLLIISDSAKSLFKELDINPILSTSGIYEVVVFQTIAAPHTIYEDVYTTPIGSCTTFANKEISHKMYWKLSDKFSPKLTDYEDLVARIRRSLEDELSEYSPDTTAVALSGGIDSGGLLGMATQIHNRPIASISMGGHGKSSGDLINARKSAAYNKSSNTEVYPTRKDLAKLPYYFKDMNQPVGADTVLGYGLLFESAEKLGVNGLIYGVGAEMLLGNLKIAKAANVLSRIEAIFPRTVLRVLYALTARMLRLSETQRSFLSSFSWNERFMLARGALFSWESNYFTKSKIDFWSKIKTKQEALSEEWKTLPLGDQLVCMYVTSWVNYLQLRDLQAIGRRFNIKPLLPFNTAYVAHSLFLTPTKFRKKKNWDKQVIRDVFKPHVYNDLYCGKVRSLIIPYSKMLQNKEDQIISYLEESAVVRELFDFKSLRADLEELPEQGLFLLRILGVVLWYDANWGEKGRSDEFIETVDKTMGRRSK